MSDDFRQLERALDDPEALRIVLGRALARNPQVAGEALGKFAALGELRKVIRENTPKLASWIDAEIGNQRVSNAGRQFVTYLCGTAEVTQRGVEAAGGEAVEAVRRTLRIKIEQGATGEELLRVLDASCAAAVTGYLATVVPALARFVGGVKAVAHSVVDTANSEAENLVLRCERILDTAGALPHVEADRDS